MEIDPHTLQKILQRIYQQMRCPQCGSRIPVDFSSVRVVALNALLLQLKCDGCGAFIVLHATLQGGEELEVRDEERRATANISSTFNLAEDEAKMLRAALEESGGSFEALFKKYGIGKQGEGE